MSGQLAASVTGAPPARRFLNGSTIAQVVRSPRFRLRTLGAAILLIGGIIRLTGFNFQLPYLTVYDESWFFWNSMSWRGAYPVRMTIPGYPPGIFFVNSAAQIVVEQTTHDWIVNHIGDAVALARFWGASISVVTALIIGLLARYMAGEWAGLLAMASWLAMQSPLYHSAFALPAPWLMFLSLLALYWAIIGLNKSWPGWVILSTLAALLAVVFKYSAVPVLGFGVVATLWHMREKGRWRWLRALVVQILLVIACAAALFFVYNAGALFTWQDESEGLVSGGLSKLLNIPYDLQMIGISLKEIGMAWPIFALVMVGGAILYLRRRDKPLEWLLIAVFGIGHAVIVVTYLWNPSLQERYILPATIGYVIIIAISIREFVVWSGERLHNRWPGTLLAAAFCCVWLVPQAIQSWKFDLQRTRPDTRGAFLKWAAINLGPGGVIYNPDTNSLLTHEWGGYAGTPPPITTVANVIDHPIDDWFNHAYRYAMLDPQQLGTMSKTQAGQDYLDRMLFVKKIPQQDSAIVWQGPEIDLYRLQGVQHKTAIDFGGQFRLTGFDLNTSSLRAGTLLQVGLYWQALRSPTDNYSVFLHIYPQDRMALIAQTDGAPGGSVRPTLTWTDPDETIISPAYQVRLPDDLKPGCYRLAVGLYNYQTGQRLATGEADYAVLAPLCVDNNTSEF